MSGVSKEQVKHLVEWLSSGYTQVNTHNHVLYHWIITEHTDESYMLCKCFNNFELQSCL